jgi:hypothetical protein
MNVFLKYVDNYSAAINAIKWAETNSVQYQTFDIERLSDRATNRQGLRDHLILPIQRVVRYTLLLKGTHLAETFWTEDPLILSTFLSHRLQKEYAKGPCRIQESQRLFGNDDRVSAASG